MRLSIRAGSLLLLVFAGGVLAQEEVTLDGRPVRLLSNDKLTLAVRSVGGTMTQLLLREDPEKLNPLEGLGHFVCVDGFGPVSKEERAAGLPGHGEARRVPWTMLSAEKKDGTLTVAFTATLPIVQETFRRTFRMVDGESVVYIDSELESLLGFDRPVNWGEHATIGGPFLEQGKTVTDMSARRAMTRSYASEAVDPPDHHNLADEKEFTWPMAPTAAGPLVDMRIAPTITPVMDQTTSLMDQSRRLVFVTAIHPGKQALFGYVFRREEYPWTQIWDSYPGGTRRSSRGLEFAAQPFDLPRREVIQAGSMFGTPTYRWLPAKSTIGSSFVMFYTKTPAGFTRVDDVVLEGGKLTIEDRGSGKTIVLNASRGL
jgi:hypothetical protein